MDNNLFQNCNFSAINSFDTHKINYYFYSVKAHGKSLQSFNNILIYKFIKNQRKCINKAKYYYLNNA
jgi:hypothetical protein